MSAEPDLDALHARYETALAGATPPFAFVDLDALRANARLMLEQANGLPIRVASKSIRSVEVLRRALALDDRFRGVLASTVREALWLAERGFDDVLVAYPSADRGAIGDLVALAAEDPARAPIPMVDDGPHLDLIESAIGSGRLEVPVCMDVDVGWWPAGGRLLKIGPKRSPVHHPERARRLAAEIAARPGTRLAGLMAYEGHIAGVGDDPPGHRARGAAIRLVQARAERDIHARLPRIVAAVREAAGPLGFVNGGGTGSLARTAAAGIATELSAGSGFYAPTLFDAYRSLALTPAAFFVLPVVRRPTPGVVTALGGGYPASGPAGADRAPQPYLPPGLRLDSREGAGETQTPLLGMAARELRVGDRVYMRHAKAGEMCERFNSLYLVEGERVVDQVPTYRGDGQAFL